MKLNATLFCAVQRLQHRSTTAAFAAWKDSLQLAHAQKQMLKRCMVRLQKSELAWAFSTWRSSIPMSKAMHSMSVASIARWRSRYACK